jgi:hypothetical protein
MTEQEKIKYAYECMVKNNPDEAVKELIKLNKENKELKSRIRKAIEIIDCQGTYRLETADYLYSALRGEDKE